MLTIFMSIAVILTISMTVINFIAGKKEVAIFFIGLSLINISGLTSILYFSEQNMIVKEMQTEKSGYKILAFENKYYNDFEMFKSALDEVDKEKKYHIENFKGKRVVSNINKSFLVLYADDYFDETDESITTHTRVD